VTASAAVVRRSEAPAPLVISDVRVVDGRGVRADRATVHIRGGRIEAITESAPDDAVAQRIDGAGMTLVPGLMNAHVHVTMDGTADPAAGLAASGGVARITRDARDRLRATLRAGVTTVRDLGAPEGIALALAAEVERGELAGPRILAAGRPVCAVGGHGHTFMSVQVVGPDAAAAAAREQLAAGARVIKVMATGGMMTPGQVAGQQQLDVAEMRAVVAVARAAGVPVAAHSEGIEGTLAAIEAGVSSIEHGHGLDAVAVERMRAGGIALVPTLLSDAVILRHGRSAGIPDFVVAACERLAASLLPGVRAAIAAGVDIVAGNDGGAPLVDAGDMVAELELYVQEGMTPVAALDAATAAAARLFGLPDVGRLEVGCVADLLLVDGDPVTDIGALRAPGVVIARGAIVRDDRLPG
jgi:imidazolonepropionase-like amidohydrolase